MPWSVIALAAIFAGPPTDAGGGERTIEAPAPRVPGSLIERASGADGGGISLGRRAKRRRSNARADHGVHVRSGIVLVPSFVLGQIFETYGNAACRREVGDFARGQGTNAVGGCNYYVEGGYRLSRGRFAVQASLGYTRLFMPPSVWVSKGEDVGAADLVQVRLHLATAQLDFIGEWPISRRVSWRLGASVGVGLLLGGLYRTQLGSQPAACSLETAGDLSICRPFRAAEFDEPWRDDQGYADCSRDECSEADLIRAGRAKDPLPSMIPVGRIFTGPRVQVTDRLGVAADVGVGVGVTFGLSLDARFGR